MSYRYGLVASVIALAVSAQRHVPAGMDSGAGANAAVARCAVTPIRTSSLHQRDLAGLPWIEARPVSSGITGYLFYAYGLHGTAAEPRIHGTMPDGRSTKILWRIENAKAGRVLNVDGRNLTGGGAMHQLIPRASSPATDYPSILNVPAPGCWQFSLTSGALRGTVRLRVIG